jgi:hypothetical protein
VLSQFSPSLPALGRQRSRAFPRARIAAVVLAVFTCSLAAASPGQAQATTVSFTDTGCSTWTVPAGVSAVHITATGAAGQAGRRVLSPGSPSVPSGAGGAGGVVSGTLSGLGAGEVLGVCVNQGFKLGGPDPDGGGGGQSGGASGVTLGSDPVLIAGGGGGGGDGGRYGSDQAGGSAGLPDGVPGQDAPAQPGALGGGGGSQTQGGAGGAGDSSTACGAYCGPGGSGTGFKNGAPGTGGNGGQILTITGGGGGAGGGGYYGGGGGGSGATPCTNCGHSGGAGGGGGSDFCATSLPAVTFSGCAATGYNSSPTTASVVFTYGSPSPPTCSNSLVFVAAGQPTTMSFHCNPAASPITSYAIVGAPSHGTLGPIDQAHGTVTYTPSAGYRGPDSFTYRAHAADGGVSNVATVATRVFPRPPRSHFVALQASLRKLFPPNSLRPKLLTHVSGAIAALYPSDPHFPSDPCRSYHDLSQLLAGVDNSSGHTGAPSAASHYLARQGGVLARALASAYPSDPCFGALPAFPAHSVKAPLALAIQTPVDPCRVYLPTTPIRSQRGIALGIWVAHDATVVLTITKGTAAALTTASSPKPLLTRSLKVHSGDNALTIKKLGGGKPLAAGRYALTFVEIYKGKSSKKVSHALVVKP